MINRQTTIKSSTAPLPPVDFAKLRVGNTDIQDIIFNVETYAKKTYGRQVGYTKEAILDAIHSGDVVKAREISNYYFFHSGIYSRLCRYMAYMYKYDWFVTPHFSKTYKEKLNDKEDEVDGTIDNFFTVLDYMDDFQIKRFCGETALKVIRNGCYYGYIIASKGKVAVQELPCNYCRVRYYQDNYNCVVEFNMQFFDDRYPDSVFRNKVLKAFPPEFLIGYKKYKAGKLKGDYPGDAAGWYVLNPKATVKFNMNGDDMPFFISTIPAILDLEDAEALNKMKLQQQLLKIIIQKMPLDKNGDMIFDMDEMAEMHKNAVLMLGRALGIEVLTTLADVDVADLSDHVTSDSAKEVDTVKSTVFDAAGVSIKQFNTDGNIALNYSTLNDAASMLTLVQQFEAFLNTLLTPFNKSKKIHYKAQILGTTIYNYQELAKLYKEQTQLGYSKFLPQIALGQSQSSVLANAYFENDILDLVNVFIPPLMSSTMNGEFLTNRQGGKSSSSGSSATGDSENSGAGRPEKDDNQKSEKTIQNKEAMG